ncbi:STM3941 family protein [Paenibacillus silvae]|uniref:STM3941 family protein n=1 Tax=Paenibacillus silvae TaxID=1325358 RepID=UPI0025A284F2|nr:STM3941 family protein [Paenibacillus silvae]MDM5279541.1 STM3941 family protein [Paenibacillus silvae]
MNTSYEQHVEYPSRKRMAWLTAGAALFVCAGFFLIFDQSFKPGASIISSVIGFAAILFFGICFCYSLIKMIRKEPSFVIHEQGFIDSSSYASGGEVAWKDIEHIFMYELMGQEMIGVKLRDEKEFLERQNGMKRKLMTANSNMVDATISIAQSSISLPLDQLYLMMMSHWRHARDSRG